MADPSVKVVLSDSLSAETRAFVDDKFRADGVAFESSNDRLMYESFGTSAENGIVHFVGFIALTFTAGIAKQGGGRHLGFTQRAVQEDS